MADNARSPSICPWDPGEVCKAPHGASLPPRKRLLAGLKQNGWLCSTPPYFQAGVSRASCAPEELRLEVDLRESKHECIGDAFSSESPTRKQGECKAVEKLVSVKSKRATKRRKSLSVLVDCRNSVKNLHPELLKSCAENEIQEIGRCNKVPNEALLSSNMEKASVHSYQQMVDDARAAAAKAAKAAAEAKAIALQKAAVAAKAAAIARAALEAVALAVENEVSECKPSRHVWAPCEQNRISNGERANGLLEKTKEKKRTPNGSSSNENKKTQAGKGSTAASHPVDISVLDGIKEDKGVHSGQNCIVAVFSAPFDTPSGKHEEAEETCAVACPMPPPFDDERLARQLHRAMNSSPRIFGSRASLDYHRKIESFPSSIEGCTQIRYQQVGGCSSSREKKQIHKLRVSRSNNGKADIKTKSMTAINDKLNMLQRATATRDRVLDSTGPCSATSREYANKLCQMDDNSSSDDSDGTFVSFNKCMKNGNFTGICDIDGSHKAGSKGEGNNTHCISYVHDSGTMGRDDEPNATKSFRIIRKLKSRRRNKTAVSIPVFHQSWDDNRAKELPFTCNDIQSHTTANVVSEQTGSHLETYDKDYEGRGENQDGRFVSRPGTFIRVDATGTPTVKTVQENLIHSKSSRATRKISRIVLHGEMQKRGQKVMNGNLLSSTSSYLPSPTAL